MEKERDRILEKGGKYQMRNTQFDVISFCHEVHIPLYRVKAVLMIPTIQEYFSHGPCNAESCNAEL